MPSIASRTPPLQPPGADSPGSGPGWARRLAGPAAAGIVLALFWVLLIGSLREKSLTYDELATATAGYSYWRYDDYRLVPENGNLPQRVAAIPLITGRYSFPSLESEDWRASDVWKVGYAWFFRMGHDAAGMAARGRAACSLFAVALGALVWLWSRRLFGPAGGMVSLLLYVLSPTVLANGALMTSDTASSFFFLASIGCLWRLLHRITVGRLAASSVVMAGLCLSKMSAVLVVPMAAVLLAARIGQGAPLPVELGRLRWSVGRRGSQLLALGAAAVVHGCVVAGVIWAAYEFRYPLFAHSEPGRDQLFDPWEVVMKRPDPLMLIEKLDLGPGQRAELAQRKQSAGVDNEPWKPGRLRFAEAFRRGVLTPVQCRRLDRELAAPPASRAARLVDFARRHRLLPEAYLYGLAYTWRTSQARSAFLNGEVSVRGWRWFFPYTFVVKTPLPVFGIILLSLAAAALPACGAGARLRLSGSWGMLYETLPLWALLGCYWAAAMVVHLNIGHRHVMPTYAPLFILCGAAARWWRGFPWAAGRASAGCWLRRAAAGTAGGLLMLLAWETLSLFPNYIAYFNAIAGGPGRGYRHLVDSSLDWGQDLPGLRRYVEKHRLPGPVYLSYFGNGSPDYWLPPEAHVRYLFSDPGQDVRAAMSVVVLPAGGEREKLADLLRREADYEEIGSGRNPQGMLGVMLLKKPQALRLRGGTYFISATMLQPVSYGVAGPLGPLGPWNRRYEAFYQDLYAQVRPLMDDDPSVRATGLRRHNPSAWPSILGCFEMLRFARLSAFLRRREPDDEVGFSILVYRLTDGDLAAALDGPPPELGRDIFEEDPR